MHINGTSGPRRLRDHVYAQSQTTLMKTVSQMHTLQSSQEQQMRLRWPATFYSDGCPNRESWLQERDYSFCTQKCWHYPLFIMVLPAATSGWAGFLALSIITAYSILILNIFPRIWLIKCMAPTHLTALIVTFSENIRDTKFWSSFSHSSRDLWINPNRRAYRAPVFTPQMQSQGWGTGF